MSVVSTPTAALTGAPPPFSEAVDTAPQEHAALTRKVNRPHSPALQQSRLPVPYPSHSPKTTTNTTTLPNSLLLLARNLKQIAATSGPTGAVSSGRAPKPPPFCLMRTWTIGRRVGTITLTAMSQWIQRRQDSEPLRRSTTKHGLALRAGRRSFPVLNWNMDWCPGERDGHSGAAGVAWLHRRTKSGR